MDHSGHSQAPLLRTEDNAVGCAGGEDVLRPIIHGQQDDNPPTHKICSLLLQLLKKLSLELDFGERLFTFFTLTVPSQGAAHNSKEHLRIEQETGLEPFHMSSKILP